MYNSGVAEFLAPCGKSREASFWVQIGAKSAKSLKSLLEFYMAIERTLSIIKPDASRMAHLSQAEAEQFYAVHAARPFFKDLVSFMISGPVMIQVLEGEGAIAKNRDLMGATDPKKADKGTIRADFADSIDANAVHGSDAPETAAVEVAFFFAGMNVFNR
jgi:nucleoside-diphosphate kinase